MELTIIKKGPNPDQHSDFYCRDEEGESHLVDIFVDGGIPSGITDDELIGRTIEISHLHPYLEIASDVKLLPLAKA